MLLRDFGPHLLCVDSPSAGKQNPNLLWNPNVHCLIHNSTSLFPILGQTKPEQTHICLTVLLSHLRLGLLNFLLKLCMNFPYTHACCMSAQIILFYLITPKEYDLGRNWSLLNCVVKRRIIGSTQIYASFEKRNAGEILCSLFIRRCRVWATESVGKSTKSDFIQNIIRST
jgi:hypothetical protein